MLIQFATCERPRALLFLQKVYPLKDISDTPESARVLLDFVEKDIVRIEDPMMYGNKIKVVPGRKWVEDEEIRDSIVKACEVFST